MSNSSSFARWFLHGDAENPEAKRRASQLVRRVMERSGLASESDAAVALEATLRALSLALPRRDAVALVAELPGEWGQLTVQRTAEAMGLEDVAARVAERLKQPVGRALEVTQAVCAALAQELEPATRAQFRRRWPEPLRDLLQVPTSVPPPRPVRLGEHTLASGRPGSERPLSETAPSAANPIATGRPGSKRPLSGG